MPLFCSCHKAVVAESRKEGSSLVSAITINKALKKGGEVLLAVTVTEESEHVGSVPDVIAGLLEGYRDVMPLKLPKSFHQDGLLIIRLNLCLVRHHCGNLRIACPQGNWAS